MTFLKSSEQLLAEELRSWWCRDMFSGQTRI